MSSLPPRQRRPPAKLRSTSPETIQSPKKKARISQPKTTPTFDNQNVRVETSVPSHQLVMSTSKTPTEAPKRQVITNLKSPKSEVARKPAKQGPTAFEDALSSADKVIQNKPRAFAPSFTLKTVNPPTSSNNTHSLTLPVATQLPRVASTSTLDAEQSSRDSSRVPSPAPSEPAECKEITHVFKDPNFVHSSKGAASGKKTRVWKNLKQISAMERALPWKPDDAYYCSIDAPPSFKPPKKYSDITGLTAKYTDPQTKIRYATTEEFARIRILPSDIVAGYLTLRKANPAV